MLQEWARARAACSAEQSETLKMYDYIDTMHLGNLVPTHLAATRVESRNSVGGFLPVFLVNRQGSLLDRQ